ncbi:uncharacterized protein LOC129969659 [Argiope bruennichi]|uniref:uncharacterized protein LOC129969659 n=1 Tax=Argiope bruennichi TaxID=94029 RepID=UPI00249553C7|nr:uncharacterized protein LOC129969659 [Argiope bruennichi]
MFPLGILLLLLPLLQTGFCNDCQAGFADSCFVAVSYDLQYMLNLKEMVTKNVSKEAVHELCLAIEDSLNCTEDIIDGDCSRSDGRYRFDSWLKALRGAYRYVCRGKDHDSIKMLLQSTSCWSLEDFVLCIEDHMDLKHVRDLLHTEINAVECEKLHREINLCSKLATTGSCREQFDIDAEILKMIEAFFSASDCGPMTYRGHSMAATSASLAASTTLIAFCLLWLL